MRCALVVALIALPACTVERGPEPAADADPANPYPPPRSDVVPAIGSADTFEIATWNLHNFPSTGNSAQLVADLITSLDLDVVVVEEIASETAWDELLARLPEHEGSLSSHQYGPDDYQKIGVIYRASIASVGTPELLFPQSFAFPRPAFALPVTVDGDTVQVIGIHLKAGVTDADAERRREAVVILDTFLRQQVDAGGEPEFVVLGDYNERVTSESDRAILAPLLTAPDRYTIRTEPPALAGAVTYLGFGGSFIDHITTSAALDLTWPGSRIDAPRLDLMTQSYRTIVSDHLPAIMVVPRTP